MTRTDKKYSSTLKFSAILVVALLIVSVTMNAQRKVTPVQNPTNTPVTVNENKSEADTFDRSRLVEMADARGNMIMVDTLTGKEWIDTLGEDRAQIPKMIQPLIFSASAGIDLFTPVLRAFGQHYGMFEVSGEFNFHNRYIPVLEFGLGQANYAPDDNNYVYKSPVAPFFRIGANYNFLYNSNPDYMVFAGLRYGFTPFRFSVDALDVSNNYWDTDASFKIPSQNIFAGYFDVLIGLRVRIYENFSLGWTIRYRSLLHESKCQYGEPWYIPGLGSRNTALGATFTVTYTFPLAKSRLEEVTGPAPHTHVH